MKAERDLTVKELIDSLGPRKARTIIETIVNATIEKARRGKEWNLQEDSARPC